MLEYRIEQLLNGTRQDQMNALALAGWRLVAAHAEPFQTENAQAVYVSYWEREIP